MTEPAGRHPFVVAAWMLVGAVVVATGVGILGGILSKSLVVDLVAMWPLFGVILLAGIIGWLRRRKKERRAGAILPLAVFTALVLAVAVHLGGWSQLPSAAARLTGSPAVDLSEPTLLTVQIVGDLEVGPATGGPGYRVDPILRGGLVGVPEAVETSVDGAIAVRISAADAPSWYMFSGWKLGLTPDASWRLVLNGKIDADLSSLRIESGAMAGSGAVALGDPPPGGGNLVVAGDFHLTVPGDAPVRVSGAADVPEDWLLTESGATAPGGASGGDGWIIDIQGETRVTVVER